MKTTPDPFDKPLVLPPKPAPAPAPQPQPTHVTGSIWRKPDGTLETRDYKSVEPTGWPCRLTDQQLAELDAWEC